MYMDVKKWLEIILMVFWLNQDLQNHIYNAMKKFNALSLKERKEIYKTQNSS